VPKGPFENKRYTLTTRITEDTRRALEAAAQRSGRSLSQEIEGRLEQSLRDSQNENLRFGDLFAQNLFQLMAAVLPFIEARTGSSWHSDYDTFSLATRAWDKLIAAIEPEQTGAFADKVAEMKRLVAQVANMPDIDDPANVGGEVREIAARVMELSADLNSHRRAADEAVKAILEREKSK
jgi:hypothetical protein